MSTAAKEAKARMSAEQIRKARAEGKKVPMLEVRHRNRCLRCGRAHGYMRKFKICRICFRNLALSGDIPGVTKSSW
ncbi:MAG: type Z 30S ribosomal protein S14 [Bryobacteraceae bacterium]|jgi:small subunit ribosomal protein S14|nr:type Z 30S ribosomal protein S14 [Solibacteraceae bacterium]MCL4841402.1 type Z 30S ribosomal protein S14 [Bryobacteraceae bacterium]MCO5350790.1 type Z 30S ribosomal protein S14 [Bryobacteraceae bacterium]HRJ19514.1 type Z 30S ribosomal protein S14 [Bryobacteraceae bacterium]